jgi:hypothetical protein
MTMTENVISKLANTRDAESVDVCDCTNCEARVVVAPEETTCPACGGHGCLADIEDDPDELRRQRDELLAALRDARQCMENGGTWSDVAECVDAAIDGAKGGNP